jgi:transcriptional regulator with XRE-family HTH domain
MKRLFSLELLDYQVIQAAMTPERIRKIRRRSGLKQSEFARALEVSQSIVSQWENGQKSPQKPYVATLRQWDKRLSEVRPQERRSWAQEIVSAAVAAGLFAVLQKLFEK